MGPQPLAQRHDARFRGSKKLVATRCEKVQWGARNAIEVYLSHHPETCHQRRIGRWRKPLETGRSTQTKFASGRTSRLLFGYEVSRGGGPGRAFHPLSGLVATSHKSSKYKDGRIGGQTGRSQLSGPVGSGRRSASRTRREHISHGPSSWRAPPWLWVSSLLLLWVWINRPAENAAGWMEA